MEDLKAKWEAWYGDLVAGYQWGEVEYNGRPILYVSGTATVSSDDKAFASGFMQVLCYANGELVAGEEQEEIADFFRSRHAIPHVSFWIE